MYAFVLEILPDGSGRSGRFILSTSTSLMSFIILPDAKTTDAANAAKTRFNVKIVSGLQIKAAIKTETKVITKFKGRIRKITAVSFSINSINMMLRVLPKLTKKNKNISILIFRIQNEWTSLFIHEFYFFHKIYGIGLIVSKYMKIEF